MKLPLSVRWDLSPLTEYDNYKNNKLFWTQAYDNLQQARNKVTKRFDPSRRSHNYKVGDFAVYRRRTISNKANEVSAKLLSGWSKPVVIAKIVRPNTVLLANPETGNNNNTSLCDPA
jgi:hypothetical protein